MLFSEVLNTAVYGKLIKVQIQETSLYTYVLPYLKNTEPFLHLEKKERESLASKINEAAWVYDNIAIIQFNVAQVRADVSIDIRRFSLNQLYKAKDLVWCHNHANMIARRSKRPNYLAYSEDQYQDLLATIRQHPCFREVHDDASQASSLLFRLQKDLVRRALPRD